MIPCPGCKAIFETEEAMLSHRRSYHGWQDDLDWYASRITALKREIAVLTRELHETEQAQERAARQQAREYMKAANADPRFAQWREERGK